MRSTPSHRAPSLPVLLTAVLVAAALALALPGAAAAQEPPPLLRPDSAGPAGAGPASGAPLGDLGDLGSIFGLSGDLSPFATFTLPAGGAVTIEFDVTVDNPLAAGVFQVGNQSNVTADQVMVPVPTDDPDTGAANDATLTNLLVTADLTAAKTDVPASGTAVPGNPITYSVTFGNDGPAGVLDAPVTDTFPGALANCTWSCAASAGGNCDTANGMGSIATTVDLEVGGTATFSITCDVDPAATGSLANTASIAVPAMVMEVDGSDNSATDTNTLTPQGDLSISKTTTSAPVVPGATETYQVVVSNSGPSTAAGVDVSDVFPAASYSNVSWTCAASAGSSCTAGPVNGDLSDTVTLAPSGTATYTITVDVDGGATGTLTNTASLTVPAGFTDTNPGNESDSVTDNLNPSGDLSVTKTTVTSPVVPGGPVQYQVVVANSGPSDAVDAVVTDTFAATLSNLSWTCAASAGSACAASGNGNISEMVTVAGGGDVTFTVSATVDPAATGNLVNTATVTPPAGFDDATNGNDSDTTTDALAPSGDLSVTKTTLTGTVVAGQPVQYQVVVTNGGPSTATGAQVQDNFPGSLANEAWTCVASAGSSCTAGGNGDILDSVTLLAGGTATYSVTADLVSTASGTLDNTATVAVPGGFTDGNLANNSAGTSDAIAVVTGLSVTKTDGVTSVPPAGTLTYTITVTNGGPSTATGATVTDVFPAELSGVSWTCAGAGGGTCTAGPVNGDVNDVVNLPPGASVTYTASGTGNSIGTVSNTATVAAPAGATDPAPGDNSATDETFVGSPADVSGTKTVGGDTTLGGTVFYTVTLLNTGTGEQLNNPGAEFTDVLPPELILVGASVVSGGGGVSVDLPNNTVTWNGAIPVNGTVVIEIEATVDAGAAGASISNQGEISYDMDGDGNNESTRLTDDPQVPGAEDPTVFQAGSILDIPTLSPVGVGLLMLLLAGLGLWRMRRRGGVAAGLALVLLLGVAGAAGAQTTVDDFATAQGPNEDPPGTVASTADGAVILGGERDLVVTRFSGPGTVSGEATGGTFVFDAPVDTRGQVEITWDGNDDDADALDPTGLGGVDLTTGGQSGFRITVDAADAGVALLMEVWTDAGNSSRAGRNLEAIGAATSVFVPFSDFLVALGSGADFADVGAVRLTLSGTGVGATLAEVATAGPALVAGKVDLNTSGVPLGATAVAPGGTIRYRVQLSNSGSDATTVDVNDLVDTNTNLVAGTIRSTPVPVGDSYSALGNVTLTVPAGSGLLANDVDPDGDVLTINTFDAATAEGGTVQNVDPATGAFEYLPPAGYRGVDRFTYTVQDDDGNLVTATVNILLNGVVWFVDSDNEGCGSSPCGSGTSADPFEYLAQAETASLPGDWIRLRDGATDLTDHDTGIVLKDGQNLIGEAVALVIDGQTIEAAGSEPELTHSGPGGHGIVLTGNHVIRGLQIDGANGTAITGTNLGTVTISDVTIEDGDPADGGAALDLDTVASLDATFGFIQSNGSNAGGIRLNGVAGTLTVTGATTLTDPVDHGLRIEASPALTATFSGGVTVTGAGDAAPDPAIHLLNNGGALFNFGALSLATENGDGLLALNGGTVNLTSSSNVIQATGGAALDIQGTTGQTGGSPGWTFQSLSSTASPDQGVRIGDLGQDLLVNGTTTVLNADLVGILVQSAAGRSVDFGATSVTDDNVGGGADGNGIDLAGGNVGATFTFDSLNVVTDGGFGVLAINSGTINVAGGGNVVNATGGAALDLTATTLGGVATFANLSSSGSPGKGVNLDNVVGGLNAAGGAIASATGVAFDVNGGNGVVTYNGTITNTANRSVEVTGRNAGAPHPVSFGGAITDSGAGVLLDDNDVVTLAFSGGLDLDTTSNDAFVAVNGGTLDVTQDNVTIVNTVDTTTGHGVRIENTTVGGSGVTFRRVSVNGAPTGIRLDTTGSLGTFAVVGDGTGARNGSGGVIQGTTNDGIELFSANGVELTSVDLLSNGHRGIHSTAGGGFTFSAITIDQPGQTGAIPAMGDPVETFAWYAEELGGTNRLEGGSLITRVNRDLGSDGVSVRNTTTNLPSLVVSDVDFTLMTDGNDAFRVEAEGTVTMDVQVVDGSRFTRIRGNAIQVSAIDSSSVTALLAASEIQDANPNAGTGEANAVRYTASNNASVDVTVRGNLFDDLNQGVAVNAAVLVLDTFNSGQMTARVENNVFTNLPERFGVDVVSENDTAGSIDLTFRGNVVGGAGGDEIRFEGLRIGSRQNTVLFNANIGGNVFTNAGTNSQEVVELRAEDDTGTFNLLIHDNDFTTLNTADELIDLDSEVNADLNATVLRNVLNPHSGDNEFEANSEGGSAANNFCLDLRGNNAGASGTYVLTEAAGSVFVLEDLANVAANNVGTVTVGAGIANTAGNCTLPPTAASVVQVAPSSRQSTAVSTAFALPLEVIVVDANGEPVAGATVNFSAPGAGASGTFTGGASTVTNAGGFATRTFTANGIAGSYEVTASSPAVAGVATFSLTNTP